MHRLILVIAAAAVPAVSAGPALAAPQGEPVRSAVIGAPGAAVSTPPASDTTRLAAFAWRETVGAEPSSINVGSEAAPSPALAPPTARYAGTTPRAETARAPPLPVETD